MRFLIKPSYFLGISQSWEEMFKTGLESVGTSKLECAWTPVIPSRRPPRVPVQPLLHAKQRTVFPCLGESSGVFKISTKWALVKISQWGVEGWCCLAGGPAQRKAIGQALGTGNSHHPTSCLSSWGLEHPCMVAFILFSSWHPLLMESDPQGRLQSLTLICTSYISSNCQTRVMLNRVFFPCWLQQACSLGCGFTG